MSEAGTRAPRKRSVKYQFLKLMLFFSGVFILYILVFHIWPLVRPYQTEALRMGELKKLYPAEGILVRDETVITSPAGGQLSMLVQEGERVRPGESIAEVKTLAGNSGASVRSALIRAPRSGVVIRQTDGLEGVLNPGQLDILEIAGKQLNGAESAGRGDGKISRYEKGQPVMKIVDNLSPLAIFMHAPGGFPGDRLNKGGLITMVWENNQFTGRIAESGVYGGRTRIIVKALSYPGGFLQMRKVVLALEGGTVSGCIVPAKSLVTREGREGLYIMNKSRSIWVPVRVEGVVNDMAAVSGDRVSPGTRYVVNPHGIFNRGPGG